MAGLMSINIFSDPWYGALSLEDNPQQACDSGGSARVDLVCLLQCPPGATFLCFPRNQAYPVSWCSKLEAQLVLTQST